MNSIVIASVIFACAFGGGLVGIYVRGLLPVSHLSPESKDVIKLGTGLIASMAALVLGLLVASAKSEFDAQSDGIEQLGANIVLLDHALAFYGPEAKPMRLAIHQLLESLLERSRAQGHTAADGLTSRELTAASSDLRTKIRDLAPTTDSQRAVQSQALQICTTLSQTRWKLSQHTQGAMPMPFLVVLSFWLAVLFAGFGLFSPHNGTIFFVHFVCALSMAGAVFLIIDLDQPFDGLIQVSNMPLQRALTDLDE